MAGQPAPVVTIRRAGPDDCDAFWRGFHDEEAYWGTLQVPFPSREAWRKRITDLPDSDYLLVAVVDGEVAGHAGLHRVGASPRRAHAMMLGIGVHKEWQGKGVGRALMKALIGLADNWLPVTRIELNVFCDNERAIKLYREFGFEIEGTHRAYALQGGRYVDSYAMARVRAKPPVG